MTENPLDRQISHAQIVQVTPQTAPESMPAVPRNYVGAAAALVRLAILAGARGYEFSALLASVEYRVDPITEDIVKIKRSADSSCKHHPRGRQSSSIGIG
jgi:hypothetical protein